MICPCCGTDDPNVYVGFLTEVDCTNRQCRHYMAPGGGDSVLGEIGAPGVSVWFRAVEGSIVEPREFHRVGGPAVTYPGGDKYWYLNGELHREDGPAIEYADGFKLWYLNGEGVTEEEVRKGAA